MELDHKYLSVWYKPDNSGGNSIISRRSSGRQHEVVSDDFDYKLYPILEDNVDMLLYHTVWDLIMHPDFYDFFNEVDILNSHVQSVISDNNVAFSRPYLLFPADDPCVIYSPKELSYPYIIGVFSEWGDIYAGEAGLIEEADGYPLFRNYYVPEWSFRNEDPEIVYREHERMDTVSMPKVCNSPEAFEQVVNDLLKFIESVAIDVGIWKERIMTVKEMLKNHTNELHILHNVGLYDINTLWALLYQPGNDNTELREIIRTTENELHRYAMMAVNLIDWEKGGFNKENALNK